MPECLDVSIQLPKLNVVTINELLGELDSFGIIVALQIDTTLDVAVWTNDVGAVILHFLSPMLKAVMVKIAPEDGGVESVSCCTCETFRVWLR